MAKLGVVLEEADEAVFWLEIIVEVSMLPVAKVGPLLAEANELTAIFAASILSARGRGSRQKT